MYLDQLPSAEMYERSFMHRDTLSFVAVVPGSDFVITTSVDGHLKFWKKGDGGIEFVKNYRAHTGPVTGIAVSADGTLLASISTDKTVKVFDVINFGRFFLILFEIFNNILCCA
jgi:peptidylprolyl isomerase domain and WD repeat-containing protein 1